MANPIFNTEGAVNDDNPLQVEVIGGGGGGSGDASLAEQEAQTALLTTIDTDTGSISSNIIGMRSEVASEAKQDDIITALGSQATGTKQDELKSEVVFIKNTISRSANMFFNRDTSFVTGDSPATHALGFTSQEISILNDGAGDLQISFSTDGSSFGSSVVVLSSTSSPSGVGEAFRFENVAYTHVRITWVADTAYRLQAQ